MSMQSIGRWFVLALLPGCTPLAAAQPMSMTGLPVGAHPEFHATTLEGAPFDLASARSRWVLVNFGAGWCAPCVESLPPLAAFKTAHPDVAVIAANVMDSPPKALAYLRRYSAPPMAIWLTEAQAQPLHFVAIPVTWLIAPDGKLVGDWTGTFDRAKVEQALHSVGYAGAKTP